MEGFEFLCPSEGVREGEFCEHPIHQADNNTEVIVTRQMGRVHAWLNVCPHQGRALNFAPKRFLSDDQGRLVCAAHGAVFEPDSGLCVGGPCRGASLREVAVIDTGSEILIRSAD